MSCRFYPGLGPYLTSGDGVNWLVGHHLETAMHLKKKLWFIGLVRVHLACIFKRSEGKIILIE